MKKTLTAAAVLFLVFSTVTAEARIFRRWLSGGSDSGRTTSTRITTGGGYSTSLPHDGATKIKNGWIMRFDRYSSTYGVWRGVRPVDSDPSVRYSGGYPEHGSRRYKNGHWWTFDRYRKVWTTDPYYR